MSGDVLDRLAASIGTVREDQQSDEAPDRVLPDDGEAID